jgi:putative resolvase
MERSNAYREQDLLPIGRAARFVGVSVATLRRYEVAGRINAKRTPGGQRRFVVADLRTLLTDPDDTAEGDAA